MEKNKNKTRINWMRNLKATASAGYRCIGGHANAVQTLQINMRPWLYAVWSGKKHREKPGS